jgi:hypothetical protein
VGAVKRLGAFTEEKRRIAMEIAVESGQLRMCETHQCALAEGDGVAAYRLGKALISRGDPRVAVFEGNREELSDLIRQALEDCGDECPRCSEARRR